MGEPCYDVAHLGHVELLTDRFEESLDFFTRVYGLTESGREGDSAYLRAFDDYEFHTLKLTRAPDDRGRPCRLSDRVARGAGAPGGGDRGDGLRRRLGRRRPRARAGLPVPQPGRPCLRALLRHARVCAAGGRAAGAEEHRAAVSRARRLPAAARPREPAGARTWRRSRDFMVGALGSRVTEQIELDNGRLGGCWFTVNNKSYDIGLHRGPRRRAGRLPPPDLRDRPARGRPARGRHLPRERRAHRDRAAQARDPGHVLPLCLGAGRQPRRGGERRGAADPAAGLEAGDLDRGGAQEGPGLGAARRSRASIPTARRRSTGGTRPMARTALVISAHSADFVWRCGGAIALHAGEGLRGHRASASPTASAARARSSGSGRA